MATPNLLNHLFTDRVVSGNLIYNRGIDLYIAEYEP